MSYLCAILELLGWPDAQTKCGTISKFLWDNVTRSNQKLWESVCRPLSKKPLHSAFLLVNRCVSSVFCVKRGLLDEFTGPTSAVWLTAVTASWPPSLLSSQPLGEGHMWEKGCAVQRKTAWGVFRVRGLVMNLGRLTQSNPNITIGLFF